MMGKKDKVGMMMAVMMGKKPAKASTKMGNSKKAAMPKMAIPKKGAMSKVKGYSKKMK